MKDDQNVRLEKARFTDKNKRQTKWMTNKIEDKQMEDDQNRRRPKCKTRESRGHSQKRTSNLDSG